MAGNGSSRSLLEAVRTSRTIEAHLTLQHGSDKGPGRDREDRTAGLLEHPLAVAAAQCIKKTVSSFCGHHEEIRFGFLRRCADHFNDVAAFRHSVPAPAGQ